MARPERRGGNEAARAHQTFGQRGGYVAARGARPAARPDATCWHVRGCPVSSNFLDRCLTMLFNSPEFLFGFLPAVLAMLFVVGLSFGRRAALVMLIAASLFFYGYWKVWGLIVITDS